MAHLPDSTADTIAAGVPAAAPATPADRVGHVLGGRYALLELVGSGGMGEVYRARDLELDEVVALKLLRHEIARTAEGLERFRHEVKLARRVTHRNVARTFELGDDEGTRFLTMEYVRGESLAARLRRDGRLRPERAVAIAEQVALGLEAAHAAGVVHRDIKPDNVLLAADGRVVVTDFGVARKAASSGDDRLLAGTPAYMAPEQLSTGEASARSDLYALGVLLWELLAGRLPFAGNTPAELAEARLIHAPPDVRTVVTDAPAELAELLLRLMTRDPRMRPDSARSVVMALEHLRDLTPQDSTPGAPVPRTSSSITGPVPPSVAVLPLAAAAEDAWLADGFRQDLIDALSSARGLRVLARSASQPGEGAGGDPSTIGRSLGVRAVVEGELRRDPSGTVQLRLRLIESATGVQAWSGRWTSAPDRLLALVDPAAQALAAALEPSAVPAARQAPSDALAIELYLRARQMYLHTGPTGGPTGVTECVALFEAALERAPSDPLILSGLALAEVRRWFFDVQAHESADRARRAADLAVRHGAHLGESHLARAQVVLHLGDPAAATRSLRHAIARSPSLADAREVLGRLLLEAGHLEAGRRQIGIALELDPGLLYARIDLLRVAILTGDTAREAELVSLRRPNDSRFVLQEIRFAAHRRDTAQLAHLADHVGAFNTIPTVRWIAQAMLDVYTNKQSLDHLEEVMARMQPPGASFRRIALGAQFLAEAAGYRGDVERCLRALEHADRHALLDLVWLERCGMLDPVRATDGYRYVLANVRERAAAIYDALWDE